MGLAAAEKVALAVALPLQIFYRIFSWPIRALDWASVRTVQLIGVKATAEHASTYTEEELRRLVDISRESGHLRAEERRLIHKVFEFSDTLVREAMVPRTEMAAILTRRISKRSRRLLNSIVTRVYRCIEKRSTTCVASYTAKT